MRIQVFILCLLSSFVSFGQNISISDPIPFRNGQNFKIIGKLDSQVLVFSDRNNKYSFRSLDKNMHLNWKREMEFGDKKIKIYQVFQTYDKKIGLLVKQKRGLKNDLKIFKYDTKLQLLDSITITHYSNYTSISEFKSLSSEDHSKYFFYKNNPSGKGIEGFVFDLTNFKVKFQSDFKEVNFDNNKEIHAIINNTGKVIFLENTNNRFTKKEPHFYLVSSYVSSKRDKTYNVALNGFYSVDIEVEYDNRNERLVLAGLYGNKGGFTAHGTFYCSFDPENGANKVLEFHEFDQEFLKNFLRKKRILKNNLQGVKTKKIVLRNDGGILLFNEKEVIHSYNSTQIMSPISPSGRSDEYFNENIFITSFSPKGKKDWQEIIFKKQVAYGADNIFTSFCVVNSGKRLQLLFNDNIEINTTISNYPITSKGISERISLLNTEHQGLKISMIEAIQISSNTILLPSYNNQELKILKVTF